MKKYNITKGNAREMQLLGVKKRKENAERRRLLREILSEELSKPVAEGSGLTKAEWLVAKMVQNLREDIKPSDLETLQRILGEAVTKMEVNTRPPEEAFIAMMEED